MESDIKDWIINRLSVSLPNFNDMPACPYAKQALLENKIKIIEVFNKKEFASQIDNFTINWPKEIEVLVLGCDPKLITPTELTEIVETLNSGILNERNFLALEDHPLEPEYAAGYCVNEGNWALILLQSKSKVITARKVLEKRGYYKYWSEEYYKEVVLDRT